MTLLYISTFVFLIVTFIAIKLGEKHFKKKAHEKQIKQCSFGSAEMANVLRDASDYQRLKNQFHPDMSFQDRYLVSVSASRFYSMDTLEQWVNDEPNSADASLCFGAKLVQCSWDVRGYGRGSDVSESRWKSFGECLEKTREVLTQCAQAMPSDPTPWAYLMMVSTWSGDHHDDRTYYFEQAVKRDTHNWPAHMHRVIALSEKWGGNNNAMLAFAESASENAPEGSDLPAILIKAYIENWKYLDIFEEKPQEAQAFIDSPLIQAKAVSAYIRSLGSSSHKNTATSVFARYNTSSWFWIVKDKLRLKQDLTVLGNKVDDIHWRWAGSEGELREAKKFAGV